MLAALATTAVIIVWQSRSSLQDRVPRKLGPQPDGTILVPTNQLLSPAGLQILFPGRPTDLALSPDGSLLAVKNMRDILLVRMQDRAILQTLPVEKGGQGFVGILFSEDGKRIFTTDSEGLIHVAALDAQNVMRWEAPNRSSRARGRKPSRRGAARVRSRSLIARRHGA